MDALGLVPVAEGSDLLMLHELMPEWIEYVPPLDPHYSLIAGTDGLFLLRREVAAHLDPGDVDKYVPSEQGMSPAGSISDLSCHAIVDRGRIVGFWEFDPDRSKLVTLSFIKPNPGLRDAVKRMEEYACDQLGDVRSFSLDSPSSRQPRIQALEDANSPVA